MNQIITTTLDCGMPLLVETNPGVKSAAVCWLLPIGSATDPEEKQGISTLLSELMFRGAGSHNSREQADALDRLGLSRGSDTGGLFLRLTATMVGDKIEPALGLLTDIVRRLRLDPEHLEPSRDLAMQALVGLKDDPQARAGIILGQRHNQLPLNRSGMGTEEGLKSITREDLEAAWQKHVKPRGSILGIAGAVDPVACARCLNGLLAGWEGTAPEVVRTDNASRGTYFHERDDSNQVQILLAHEAPAETNPDSTLERIVASALSGGMSARLFSEVREKRGLCYSVQASYAAEKHHGRVTAYVGTTPEKAQQSLDVLMGELKRILTRDGAVTENEFHRAVVGYKTRLVFSGESTGARAAALAGDFHRLGRARSLEEVASVVDKVKIGDVNDYLSRRTMGPVTIVTLGPRELVPPSAR